MSAAYKLGLRSAEALHIGCTHGSELDCVVDEVDADLVAPNRVANVAVADVTHDEELEPDALLLSPDERYRKHVPHLIFGLATGDIHKGNEMCRHMFLYIIWIASYCVVSYSIIPNAKKHLVQGVTPYRFP